MKKAIKRKCSSCFHFKPLTEFPIRRSKGKQRFHSWCRKCRNENEQRRKKRYRREYLKRYHQDNRSYRLKQMSRYFEEIGWAKYKAWNVYHPELLKTPRKPVDN